MLGVRTLEACRELGVATHLVVSRAAALTLVEETGLDLAVVSAKADVVAPGGRYGRGHRLGLVPDPGHDRRPLLGARP